MPAADGTGAPGQDRLHRQALPTVSTAKPRTPRRPHPALTAGELMTTPAITTGPHLTVHAAGRLMSGRHVRLLPVVDEHDRLGQPVTHIQPAPPAQQG